MPTMTVTSSRRVRRIVTVDSCVMRTLARRLQAEGFLGLADPAAHGGITIEMESALMGEARIGQQRHVRERSCLANQKSRRGQLMLKSRYRRVAALDLFGIEIGGRLAQIFHLE